MLAGFGLWAISRQRRLIQPGRTLANRWIKSIIEMNNKDTSMIKLSHIHVEAASDKSKTNPDLSGTASMSQLPGSVKNLKTEPKVQ